MIEATDLAVSLGGESVLESVSLSAGAGEFVGLIGPNGAGKTTLLRTVAGAIDPERGTATVAGEDVHSLSSRAASRRVAVVPQDTSLDFEFNVRRIVEMGRHPYRSRWGGVAASDREVVERAMERVDVARFADRSITAVSGGERQRVLLARALAQDTPAILLDEPTGSLDVTRQVETLALVRDLTREGTTAVAAIHDLDLAARFCDRLVLLADGEIAAVGRPETVLEADTLSRAFDGQVAVGASPVTGTPTATAVHTDRKRDLTVHVLGTGLGAVRTVRTLVEDGFGVTLGPVPEGDVAALAAEALGVPVVTTPPFATPATDATDAARDHVRVADACLVCEGASPDGVTDGLSTPVEDVAADGGDDVVGAALEASRDRRLRPAED